MNSLVDFQAHPNQTELLAERLSDVELRSLLERLGSSQMAGPEESTLGDVVEATGIDPIQAGALLGEIRKEALEAKFGRRLDHHEERIEKLEVKSERTVGPPVVVSQPVLSKEDQIALKRVAEEERRRALMKPVAILVLLFLALIVVSFIVPASASDGNQLPPGSVTVGTSDGVVSELPDGRIVVTKGNGLMRPATEDEKSWLRSAKLRTPR